MTIEDHPVFPRFNEVSTGLKEAEDRLLDAIRSGNKAEIATAKLNLLASLDVYKKIVDDID